jgi:hypothetical protein
MILIFDGQIAGQSTTADNLPAGFTAIEYSGTEPLENLWFDGKNIRVKPERPSDRHYWAGTDWAEMPENIIPVHEDWAGLVADLRGSGLLGKVYSAAKKTVKATTAWTMLMTALTSPLMIVEDLAFAIGDFRAMAPDVLDAEDCQLILGFLHDRGFHAEVLDQALA